MARLALPQAARGNEGNVLAPTRRAGNAIRPAAGRQEVQAVVEIGEVVDDRLLERLWCVCHDQRPAKAA